MERTDLSLQFSNRSVHRGATSDQIREICIRNLDVSNEEAAKLFEPRGTLLISTDKDPSELREIVRNLEELGVLVRATNFDNHYPVWPSAPHFPRTRVSARLSRRAPRSSATRRAKRLARHMAQALFSPSARALLFIAAIVVITMSLSRLEMLQSPFTQQTSSALPTEGIVTHLTANLESPKPGSETFTGVTTTAGLTFTMKVTTGNNAISVRVSASASSEEDSGDDSIQSLESDPIFLQAQGAQNFSGTSPTVISESPTLPRRTPAQTSISLHTLSDGTPQYALVQVHRLNGDDPSKSDRHLIATAVIHLLP